MPLDILISAEATFFGCAGPQLRVLLPLRIFATYKDSPLSTVHAMCRRRFRLRLLALRRSAGGRGAVFLWWRLCCLGGRAGGLLAFCKSPSPGQVTPSEAGR